MSHIAGTLKPKQRLAVASLAAGGSDSDAAAAAGVTRRTIIRWRADPLFGDAVREAADDIFAGLTRRLIAESHAALDQIAALSHGDAEPTVQTGRRVKASQSIVGYALRYKDVAELAERVARLEAMMS